MLGEFAVLGHACDVQGLDAYDLVFVHEESGQLVQVVLSLAGYVLVVVLVALFERLVCCCRGHHCSPFKKVYGSSKFSATTPNGI